MAYVSEKSEPSLLRALPMNSFAPANACCDVKHSLNDGLDLGNKRAADYDHPCWKDRTARLVRQELDKHRLEERRVRNEQIDEHKDLYPEQLVAYR